MYVRILALHVLSMLLPANSLHDARLLLIRHGRTEMNEHLAQPGNEWGAPNFYDPGYFDTELTAVGKQQARELHEKFRSSKLPQVDTLCSSPLRRALATAEIVFDGYTATAISKRIVTPLAAERLFLSSDVGSPIAELAQRFDQAWDLDGTLQERWWYQGDEASNEWRPPGDYLVPGEPLEAFNERMRRLIDLLRSIKPSKPDGVVALVCHAEVIYALTGQAVQNCACIETRQSALPDMPFVLSD